VFHMVLVMIVVSLFECKRSYNEYISTLIHKLLSVTGPYGEQDDEQVFIQKVVPETDQLYVRLASNGKR